MNNTNNYPLTFSDKEYKALAELIFIRSGIHFGDSRKDLLKSRLDPILRRLNLNSYDDYLNLLKLSTSESLIGEMINEVSTSHTLFFRHKKQFDFFRKDALKKILASKISFNNQELNIWCTASSTGEEPYSIAISLIEELGFNNNWSINLLATDLSTKSIETAKSGNYHSEQIKNIDPIIINKYFDKKYELNNSFYSIKEIIKCFVSFKRLNLITDKFDFEKKFDFIFCRNVFIYFAYSEQHALELKLINALDKGGYLFLGGSESLSIENSCFMKHLGQSIYQKL